VATITSAQSGNFSDTATWVGGVVPGVGDVAVAATGHVIVIDVDVTVDEVDQAGTGKFTLGNGRTLTANVTARAGTFTSGGTVEVIVTTGNTARIVGDISGVSTTAASIAGVVMSGTGRLEIKGNITGSAGNVSTANFNAMLYISGAGDVDIEGDLLGGSGQVKYALNNVAASTITVTGNITGGNATNAFGLINTGASTITITGNITGGSGVNAIGLQNSGSATITVTGNITGGGNAIGLSNSAASTITITGNITGGGADGRGFLNTAASTITVTGNITGGAGGNAFGLQNTAASTITVTGNITGGGGNGAFGLNNTGTSTITITGNITGGNGLNAIGLNNTNASAVIEIDGTLQASATQPAVLSENTASITVSGPLITSSTAQTTASASGLFPIISRRWYVKESAIETFFIEMRSSDIVGEIRPSRTLYVVEGATADSGKLPAASDVRSGVVYGFNDAGTGTCAVPPPAAVGVGVPVDATTGEAVIRQADAAAIFGAIWEQG
jgi:hypothetical protein